MLHTHTYRHTHTAYLHMHTHSFLRAVSSPQPHTKADSLRSLPSNGDLLSHRVGSGSNRDPAGWEQGWSKCCVQEEEPRGQQPSGSRSGSVQAHCLRIPQGKMASQHPAAAANRCRWVHECCYTASQDGAFNSRMYFSPFWRLED